jgi:hypothetical protein
MRMPEPEPVPVDPGCLAARQHRQKTMPSASRNQSNEGTDASAKPASDFHGELVASAVG